MKISSNFSVEYSVSIGLDRVIKEGKVEKTIDLCVNQKKAKHCPQLYILY